MNGKEQTLFREQQYFRQWWLLLILAALDGFFTYALYVQLVLKEPIGSKPMSDTGLIVTAVLTFLLSALFLSIRLDSAITKTGIYVRFFPFQRSYRFYPKENISRITLRKYKPLKEYGGWGWRVGRNGQALSVSGSEGIQMELKNKDSILIGTKKSADAQAALSAMGY